MKKEKGIVRWFDNRSGEGFIRVGEESIYVHWSAIKVKELPKNAHKNPKYVWTVLFPGQKVTVEVLRDSHFIQIDKVY